MVSRKAIDAELPPLRRFARTQTGDGRHGDALVAEVVESLASDPSPLTDVFGLRVALYRRFLRLTDTLRQPKARAKAQANETKPDAGNSYLALLLTTVEGFSIQEAALIMEVSNSQIETLIRRGARELKRHRGHKILVIESDGIVGFDLEMSLAGYGYRIDGPFHFNDKEALNIKERSPDLIIADVDGELVVGDHLSLIHDIKSEVNVPIIMLTSNPNRLFADSYIYDALFLQKPFTVKNLRILIAGTLPSRSTLEEVNAEISEELQEGIDEALASIETSEARLTPLQVIVDEDQVRLASGSVPKAVFAIEQLELLRIDYLRDADRVVSYGSNIGRVFEARVGAVKDLLNEPLTQETMLRLAAQTRALERMRPAIEEAMGKESAADVDALIDGLGVFVRKFPVWRQFVGEAEAAAGSDIKAAEAIQSLVGVIGTQPTQVVHQDVKRVIDEVVQSGTSDDPVLQLLGTRALSTTYRAVAKYLLDRAKGIAKNFNDTFDEELGKALGKGLVNMMILAAPALLVLAVRMPLEFAWAGPVLVALRMMKNQ